MVGDRERMDRGEEGGLEEGGSESSEKEEVSMSIVCGGLSPENGGSNGQKKERISW